MAESTDKKTRKIAEKRVEPGKEFEGYQEAQNQLLAIQAEQQQNLALQANDAMNVQQQNQTLAQAAEVMAMDNLNPATQGILAGYGLNQPRVIKQSNAQRQGPNNITINNTTINNASGPVQGREISIRPQEAGQSKFKAWLTNVFARQDAQWQKQNQEYARRESSLTRNSNKMMRKLEGLGKEIGNVIDPRKQAQRAQNSTMNLLKALGLVYFAKKLPDILGFFNNAEDKIRGWIGEIGDKIKEGFGLKDKLIEIFHGKEGQSVGQAFRNFFTNPNENGVLDTILKKIELWFSTRAEIANLAVPKIGAGLKVDKTLENLSNWLVSFLSGKKIAQKVMEEKLDIEATENILSNNRWARLSSFQSDLAYDNHLSSETGGLNSLLQRNNKIFGSMDRNQITSNISDAELREQYKVFKSKDENKGKGVKEFLESKSKDLALFGEAMILTKKIHDRAERGRGGCLNPNEISIITRSASKMTWHAPLSISLEIYSLLKNNQTVSTPEIIKLLKLLLNLSEKRGFMPVFDKFIKCFVSGDKLTKLYSDSEMCTHNEFILVQEPLRPSDYSRFETEAPGMWGTGSMDIKETWYSFMKYYWKLKESDQTDIEERKNKYKLKVQDYQNHIDEDHWNFHMLSNKGLSYLIENLTGDSAENLNYSKEYSKILGESFKSTGAIKTGVSISSNLDALDKDYEENIDRLNNAVQDYQDRKRQIERNAIYNEDKFDKTDEQEFLETASIKTKNGVNYSEEIVPRIPEGKPIRNVTKIFGGSGDLTSQYNEDRNGTIHHGVDFSNKQGDPVKHPIRGTVININNEKDYIDIKDDEGYVTRYHHISSRDGIEVGNTVSAGSVVGFSAKYINKWTKRNEPHIHVEVHRPGWTGKKEDYINPLAYFTEKLGSLKKEVSTETPNVKPSSPAPQNNNPSRTNPHLRMNPVPSIDPFLSLSLGGKEGLGDIINTGSLELARKIIPTNTKSVQENNNNEILLARCAEGIDYIAKSMAPLSEVINSGNMMVAETVSKSGGPTNLTPHEPQLEMNQV